MKYLTNIIAMIGVGAAILLIVALAAKAARSIVSWISGNDDAR